MDMRAMAIDYGDRRIGLAVSDPLGILAGEAWTMEEWDMERASLRISQEECAKLVQESLSGAAANPTIHEFEAAGISVVNGRYGPYIKFDGRNFRIPRGTDAAALTEEDCRKIIAEAPAPDAAPKTRRFKKRS